MSKALVAIFRFIVKTLAVILVALFVLTSIPILSIFTVEHSLFDAGTYKHALEENGVYQKLPAIVGEGMDSVKAFITDPCKGNSLGCAIDGASPELQACLTGVLGASNYEAIGSGQRSATETELASSQGCLDQFGSGESTGDAQDESGGSGVAFINNLSTRDWQALITLLLPPDESKAMVEGMLDQVFATVNGETCTARLSLAAVKAHLIGPAGADLVQLLLKTQPPCTEEQLTQIHSEEADESEQAVVCNPPPQDLDLLTRQLTSQLASASAQIPDDVVIIKPASDLVAAGEVSPGNDPLETLNKVRVAIRFTPIIPIILLMLVSLLVIRSLKGWLRWWGIPFLMTGLVVAVIGMTILPLLNLAWVNLVLPRFPAMLPAGLADFAHSLMNSIGRAGTTPMVIEAAILGIVGLVAIIGSILVDRKPKQPAPVMPLSEPTNTPE
jgi:hypothetical protein